MNGSHNIGKRVSSLDLYDELDPITGVALIVDDENEFFSGDETGHVLEMECPYATQEIADNVLAQVTGKTYKGFRAQDAQLGLDSELGDSVTVDETEFMLAYQKVSFGPGHMSEIAAPGENTVDHEYPYISSTQREIRRNRAQAYSLITKTAEEIRLEVFESLYAGVETDVLPKSEYEFTAGGNQCSSLEFVLEEGVHYYVDWGGVEYDCGTPTVNNYTTFITLALTTDAFSILYMYNNSTMSALASRITPYTDASYVRIFTRSATDFTERYSTIEQTASSISAAVSGLVDGDTCQSMIDMSLGKIELVVTNNEAGTSCSITMNSVEKDENGNTTSTIALSSAQIALNGFVTFTGLSDGTTTIDGGCIKTGTIDAERIEVGSISITALDGYSAVNTAITNASGAASAANSRVNSWTYEGTTEINGEMIASGTVCASYLKGGRIGILNEDGTETATMTPGLTTGEGLSIESQGNLYLKGAYGHFLVDDEAAWVSAGATDASAFCPVGTSLNLGDADKGVWDTLYSQNSPSITSDRNRKNSIEELPEKYLAMLGAVVPRRFKLNDGSSNRYHVGFIAQEVEEAMTAAGIDSQEFGGFIRATGTDGNEILMLRYEEFIGILLAKIKQLENRLTALEG